MKKGIVALFLAIALTSLVKVPSMVGEAADREELMIFYGTYIDRYVARCEAKKARMRHSQSENICRDSALYCLKACYFKSCRKELVDLMIAGHVGTRPYRVQYFLNGRFFDVLKKAVKSRDSLRATCSLVQRAFQ